MLSNFSGCDKTRWCILQDDLFNNKICFFLVNEYHFSDITKTFRNVAFLVKLIFLIFRFLCLYFLYSFDFVSISKDLYALVWDFKRVNSRQGRLLTLILNRTWKYRVLSHKVGVSEYFCPKRGRDFQLSRPDMSQEPSKRGLLCCPWLPCAFPIVVVVFTEVDNGIQLLNVLLYLVYTEFMIFCLILV